MKSEFTVFAGLAVVAVGLSGLTACSSEADAAGSGDTITYWASNQGSSLTDDADKLQPMLDRFTAETDVKVDLEVISWTDLYNRILTSVTSGDGPDVLNIGNTWAATLQETGAFEPFEGAILDAIGGEDRFLETSWSARGAAGEAPTSIPLYGLAYNMYYNPKLFAEAGIAGPRPPRTNSLRTSRSKELEDFRTGCPPSFTPCPTVQTLPPLRIFSPVSPVGRRPAISPGSYAAFVWRRSATARFTGQHPSFNVGAVCNLTHGVLAICHPTQVFAEHADADRRPAATVKHPSHSREHDTAERVIVRIG